MEAQSDSHVICVIFSVIRTKLVISFIFSLVSDTPVSVTRDRPTPETDFIYALTPLPPVFRRLLQCADSDTSGSVDSGSGPQNWLSHLSKVYSPASSCIQYDNPLHDYVTKRKLLRQKSIDEQDSLLMESVA